MVLAQCSVQAMNTSFFLLLNYYMVAEGFADYEVAKVLSYRFMAVALLAFPIGLFIKGRRLKPFFYLGTIMVPIWSLVVIWAIQAHQTNILYPAAMLWGLGFTCIQITALPFILLNTPKEQPSEAISMSFLAFSGMICLVGITYAFLHAIFPVYIDEQAMLTGLALLSFVGVYFVSRIRIEEQLSEKIPLRKVRYGYDWRMIFRVSIPTLIIAIGAGFTIPVINLFFLNIHGVQAETFSIMGATTFFLVVCVMVFMPAIRRRFGYQVAITLFQACAILVLFLLAITEYIKDWPGAVYLAGFLYIIRQPLMNAAGPMTSEFTMYYVGERNQEIISALNASIWSGSWFISTSLFSIMRQMDMRYVSIFLITVALYIVGLLWYAWLIRDYNRRPVVDPPLEAS